MARLPSDLLYNSEPLNSTWISVFKREEPEDTLLEQSVYSELYSMLPTSIANPSFPLSMVRGM